MIWNTYDSSAHRGMIRVQPPHPPAICSLLVEHADTGRELRLDVPCERTPPARAIPGSRVRGTSSGVSLQRLHCTNISQIPPVTTRGGELTETALEPGHGEVTIRKGGETRHVRFAMYDLRSAIEKLQIENRKSEIVNRQSFPLAAPTKIVFASASSTICCRSSANSGESSLV